MASKTDLEARVAELEKENAALRQEQRFLRLALDNIPGLVFWKDTESVYLGCNARVAEANRLDRPESIVGMTDYDLSWGDQADVYRKYDREVMASGEPKYHIVETILQADGEQRWIDVCKIPLRDDEGDIIGVLGTSDDITERKQAEAQLEIFKALADNTIDYVAYIELDNPEQVLTYVNPPGLAMIGREGQDPTTIRIADTHLPEDGQRIAEEAIPTALDKGIWSGETRLLHADGSLIDVSQVVVRIDDGAGQPRGLATIMRDITEQKQRAESRARFLADLCDYAEDGIYALRPEHGWVVGYANQAWADMLGYTVEEMLALPHPSVYAPAYTDEALAAFWTGLEDSGQKLLLETLYRHKDGHTFPVEVSASVVEHNGEKYIIGTVRDITERKRAEEELRTFKTLADNASYGITLSTLDGAPIYTNQALYEMLGYNFEAQELQDASLADAFPPEEYERIGTQIMPQLMQSGSWEGEVQYKRKDNSLFPGYVTVFLLKDEAGQPTTMVTISQDISERKEAEERLVQLKRIANQSPAVFFKWRADEYWSVEFVSDNVRQFGYTPEDFYTGRVPYGSIVHPDDLERVVAEVAQYSQDAERAEFTQAYRIITQAGDVRWTDDRTWIMRDSQGNITHYQGVVLDVTAQKQAEAERERLQDEIIEAQRETLKELSTPVIPVMDGILVMPLVGSIDTMRARDIMRVLLQGISQYRAKVVILDVTGVPLMDTGIVNHINKTIQAARLKGAHTIVTGISDVVAEAIVDLGIDWGAVETLSNLQTGLRVALAEMNIHLQKG